jgi:tetratricopeptide (TPR) repeat protein
MLSNIYIEKEEPTKAFSLLKDARESFRGMNGLDTVAICSAEALAFKRTGNIEAASRALDEALSSLPQGENLPENLSLSLAKACLENNKMEQGLNLMKNLLQINPEDKEKLSLIENAMRKSGLNQSDIDALVKSSAEEVKQINNKGVLLARNGEFDAAGKLLKSAAQRVPTNQQFLSNAAAILLADIEKNGLDYSKLQDSITFINALKDLNASHPKLPSLIVNLELIREKYSLNLEEIAIVR